MPSSEKSKPVKRLFGNSLAIRLMAWPWPQPTSQTSMPGAQPVDEPVDERELAVDERGVVDLRRSSRP